MKYNRVSLADNIGFTNVIDSKFKTGVLKINFITELNEAYATINNVSIGLLSTSNKNYPTLMSFSSKLNDLYGANVFSATKKVGDRHLLEIGALWMDSKYALEGEDIEAETIQILLDCIFDANVNDGAFDSELFDMVKKDTLDKIDAEINHKRSYAVSTALKTAYINEAAGVSVTGSKEMLDKVTPQNAYENFQRILKTSQIEIFYVSAQENQTVMKNVADAFSKIENNRQSYSIINFSPIKKEVAEISEELDVNQAKMVMVFKSELDDKYAFKILSAIYGETPFSKLFVNVREKLSLCYYCASRFMRTKNTIIVDSGVEECNIEKARTEIINQLEDIKHGNFSDSDLENTMLSIENSLSSIGDTPSSYINWLFSGLSEGEMLSPEDTLKKYKAVTRDRIIEAAKSCVLDTVYIMKGKVSE